MNHSCRYRISYGLELCYRRIDFLASSRKISIHIRIRHERLKAGLLNFNYFIVTCSFLQITMQVNYWLHSIFLLNKFFSVLSLHHKIVRRCLKYCETMYFSFSWFFCSFQVLCFVYQYFSLYSFDFLSCFQPWIIFYFTWIFPNRNSYRSCLDW